MGGQIDTHAAVAYLAVPAPPLPIPRGTVDQREREGGGVGVGKYVENSHGTGQSNHIQEQMHTGAEVSDCWAE